METVKDIERAELVTYDEKDRIFHLANDTISYIIQIEESDVLAHVYFGKRIKGYRHHKNYPRRDRGFSGNTPLNDDRSFSKDTLPQEYSSHGGMDYRLPALVIRRENGSNLLDLRYHDYQISEGKPALSGLPHAYVLQAKEAETLVITLKDRELGVYVDLMYMIYRNRSVITRCVNIRNQTTETIAIEKAASFQIDLTHSGRFDEVIALPGAHVKERRISRQPILDGIKSFESRRGSSSHQMNSFIALTNKHTTEFAGEAIGIHLVYSGNHSFEIEKDQINQTRVIGGINPYNFHWLLAANQSFQTPEILLSYSDQGLNQMSQVTHQLLQERVARGKHQYQQRPILVNNWEATYFDFTSKKLEAIIDEAKELGLEMFVLDDGWFGKRDADNSSLGDWYEYRGKLANGLKGLADYTHQAGLQFGIWVEPEMISLDSKLYRHHPDYLMSEPDRTPAVSRSQYVLDFTREEVRAAIETQLRKLLDTVDIDYVKWDMNRSLSDAYSASLGKENQGEVLHRYVLGLYELMERLTTDYPEILWEGCSGGGGRFDAGLLHYMPQSWTSDNTDAVERINIQYGTSLGYPISAMTAHVSAVPNHQTGRVTSLKTRGDVAMGGVFGYELDLTHLSEEEKNEVKEQVAFYKEIRQTVQYGDFYRLHDPFEQATASWIFVAKDQEEAVLFLSRKLANAQPDFHEIRLAGLAEEDFYRDQETGQIYSGSELMTAGLYYPDFYGDFQTSLIHFIKVEEGENANERNN
ncbi:alpha-galactosidase [Enterococcus durans]|uniref:alpha-galactosidase n=1 Tax=Enterococcus durans TaxID=53345 RepID=UPI0035D6A998